MWNSRSIETVDRSHFSSCFRKPLYKSYCFSKVPATVESFFTSNFSRALPKDCVGDISEPFDSVILFLLDGFGWRFFEECSHDYPFLRRFVDEGVVSKITSQFPSTTAAHITSVSTAQEVGKHSIYEWFCYEPSVDRIIAPLLYSIAGDKTLGNLEKLGVKPENIYPKSTFYMQLKKQGIDSFVIQPESIINSAYSKSVTKGAHPLAYVDFEQGLKTLCEGVNEKGGAPSYFFVYFSDIDSCGHRCGVDSKEFKEVIKSCMQSLEKFFYQQVSRGKRKIACLLTADHGMISVDPRTTVYVNKEIPELLDLIESNSEGRKLVPAGSCRDLFLHIKKGKLSAAEQLLKTHLSSIAEVYQSSELIKNGFFGSKSPSLRFREKIADLVVLPFENQSVWWYEKGKFEQHFYASHGGLSPAEMEIPFLFLPIM